MRAWEKGILIAFAFAIVCDAIWIFAASNSAIAEAKTAVKATLRDPESAQFSDMDSIEDGRGKVICGKVNSKNGLGGYSGFATFVYVEYKQTKFVEIAQRDVVASKSIRLCDDNIRLRAENEELRKSIK